MSGSLSGVGIVAKPNNLKMERGWAGSRDRPAFHSPYSGYHILGVTLFIMSGRPYDQCTKARISRAEIDIGITLEYPAYTSTENFDSKDDSRSDKCPGGSKVLISSDTPAPECSRVQS